MSIPAIIICDDTARLRVAALPVLDRLVVAVHRAGVERAIVVSKSTLPELPRATAWNIPIETAETLPKLNEPVLLLSTGMLVQTNDLKRLIAHGGRLAKRDGTLLSAGVVERITEKSVQKQLATLPILHADGVAEPISGSSDVAEVTRVLWASLKSSADGFVDRYFNRPVGRFLSKVLIYTPISPNQVSISATLLGLVSAWLFAQGDMRSALFGAIVLQLSAIVDCVDGDLARVLFKESPLGKWLDMIGDQVVHISVFICIGVGLYRGGSQSPVLWLAASAAIGVVISTVVILRGLTRPECLGNGRLQKLIDATTNRDFSVPLLALTAFGKVSWFLWMTAIGVHVFWVLALSLQRFNLPASTDHPTHEKAS